MTEKSRATDKKLLVNNNLDLLPLFVLDYGAKDLLENFKLNDITEKELSWNNEYKQSELDANNDLYKDEHVYKLHYLTYKKYSNLLVNGASCKAAVGISTLYTWIFHMIFEVYMHLYDESKGIYKKSDKNVAMVKITPEEVNLFSFIYTVLVQEKIIMGIKHIENGLAEFEIFYIPKLHLVENEKKVRKVLTLDYGLTSEQVDKILFVLRYSFDNENMIKACQNFVSLYNKGNMPADDTELNHWESTISNVTYFGKLLKPLFDIKNGTSVNLANTASLIESILRGDSVSTTDNTQGSVELSDIQDDLDDLLDLVV